MQGGALASHKHQILGGGEPNLVDFQERRGIASVVQWNLRPVIFGADKDKRPKTTLKILRVVGVTGIRSLKNYQYSTEAQKAHQKLAPELVVISGDSLKSEKST